MVFFTVLGVLVYLYAMGLIGYGLGMYLDVRRGMHQLMKPADDALREIEVLLHIMAVKENT